MRQNNLIRWAVSIVFTLVTLRVFNFVRGRLLAQGPRNSAEIPDLRDAIVSGDTERFVREEFLPVCNAHDLERILGYFDEDSVVFMVNPLPEMPDVFRGKEEIRQFFKVLLPGLKIRAWNYVPGGGHRLDWKSEIVCDAFKRFGHSKVDAVLEAVFLGGKVKSFRTEVPVLARKAA